MLRPKKKISKRELKQDTLITWYATLTSFYDKQKRNISIGITAVVVIVIAAVVYVKNRAENNEKAMTQVGAIFSYVDNGQYQIAMDGVPERNIPGLTSIVGNYGGTRGGDLAKFYLATCNYNLGKYDDALPLFKDFSPSDELLAVSRLSGIAACHEARGEYKDAAENYEKAASKYTKDIEGAENLNNAARSYAKAGDKAKAIELYKRLKKNFPASTFAREADRFIMQLSV
jgi:tetratricopeptide (TPR) repeat protein